MESYTSSQPLSHFAPAVLMVLKQTSFHTGAGQEPSSALHGQRRPRARSGARSSCGQQAGHPAAVACQAALTGFACSGITLH